jgi:hypothetical protein
VDIVQEGVGVLKMREDLEKHLAIDHKSLIINTPVCSGKERK